MEADDANNDALEMFLFKKKRPTLFGLNILFAQRREIEKVGKRQKAGERTERREKNEVQRERDREERDDY